MTLSKHPHHAAFKHAQNHYRRFDQHRDNAIRQNIIGVMAHRGATAVEISETIDMSATHIKRVMRGDSVLPMPEPIAAPDLSKAHCAELESAATTALRMAAMLRDDDPRIVWDALGALTRRQLQEYAVILLAAIPVDRTKSELLGWVENLAADTTEVA